MPTEFPLAALAGISLAHSGLNLLGAHWQNRQSMKNSAALMREQQRLQLDTMRRSYGIQMSGMLGSGLNPAFNGSAPAVPSAPSGELPAPELRLGDSLATGFQLSSLAEDISNKRLINENQRIQNESDRLDLLNKRTELGEYSTAYLEGDDGEFIPVTDDAIAKYKASHGGQLPDLVKLPDLSGKGRAKAINDIAELETLSAERGARRSEVDARQSEALARKSSAEFQDKINKAKITSPAVINAVVHMDKKVYDKLVADIRKSGLESTYQDLVNKRYESTSISALFDKIKSPDMSFGDKVLAVLALVAQTLVDRH